MQNLLDRIAVFVTRRRAVALGGIALLTIATGIFVPTIKTDPAPQGPTRSGVAHYEEVAAAFREHFGDPNHVMLLLVQADDVLQPGPLGYVHQLATHFREEPYVTRVEGITITPFAMPASEETGGGGGLDTLDGPEGDDPEGDDPNGGGLDTLGDDDDPEVPPELEEALGVLVRSDPRRFPMGLSSLGSRLGEIEYRPAIQGNEVTPDEAEALREALASAPLLEGRLISEDRTVTLIALFLNETVADHEVMQETVENVDGYLASHPPPRGVNIEVAGLPHLFNTIVQKLAHDNVVIVPLNLLVCLVLLFLSFRWWPGTFLPIVAVGITALMTIGSMAIAGEELNVINNIIPPLLIIIGVSDSIHIIGRYREELARRGGDRIAATQETVRSMAVACFLTSATTAVGLASLVVSRTEMLRRFGVIAGLGVMLAYVVTILFIPAAMVGFQGPKNLPNPRAPRRALEEDESEGGTLESLLVKLTLAMLRHPWKVILLSTVVLGGMIWGAFQIKVDSALLDEFEPDEQVHRATLLMEQHLDGVRPLEILLTTDQEGRFDDPQVIAMVDRITTWADGQDGVSSTTSYTDYLHETWTQVAGEPGARSERFHSAGQVAALHTLLSQNEPNPIRTFLSEDRRTARIQVRLRDIGARRSIRVIEALEARLGREIQRTGGHIEVGMTGEAYTGSIGLTAIVSDLLGSLLTAVLIIFGMLALLFRSFRLGVLSIPPNILPLAGTMAWMAARGIKLNAATVIVFSISLGLAVDGTIHVLARYREEIRSGLDRSSALLRAARGTGRAIVVSSVTLMLGFSTMLLSGFVPVRRFGELIGVTITLCLLATLVLLPALLRVAAPQRVRGQKKLSASDSWSSLDSPYRPMKQGAEAAQDEDPSTESKEAEDPSSDEVETETA